MTPRKKSVEADSRFAAHAAAAAELREPSSGSTRDGAYRRCVTALDGMLFCGATGANAKTVAHP